MAAIACWGKSDAEMWDAVKPKRACNKLECSCASGSMYSWNGLVLQPGKVAIMSEDTDLTR